MSDSLFARALAIADDRQQAEFLNEMARSLKIFCKNNCDTQICTIAEHLDSNARKMIQDLHEFSVLEAESRVKIEAENLELYRRKQELLSEVDKLKQAKEELANE